MDYFDRNRQCGGFGDRRLDLRCGCNFCFARGIDRKFDTVRRQKEKYIALGENKKGDTYEFSTAQRMQIKRRARAEF